VRLAANHAVNWQPINEAEPPGHSVLTGSILPRHFEFASPLEPYTDNPTKAKQLLQEAGYPDGFEAGECSVGTVDAPVVEAAVSDLAAVGQECVLNGGEDLVLQSERIRPVWRDDPPARPSEGISVLRARSPEAPKLPGQTPPSLAPLPYHFESKALDLKDNA
jgi:Bacterial extracellular solute-binding proteins, family 5 Middle